MRTQLVWFTEIAEIECHGVKPRLELGNLASPSATGTSSVADGPHQEASYFREARLGKKFDA